MESKPKPRREAAPSKNLPFPSLPRRAFGHNADGSGVIDEEAEAIREAARRVLGGETLSDVVQEWNRRGLVTSTGGPWRVNSLSTLLVQPRLLRSPAILDEETHTRLLALHRSRSKGPRRPTRQYLLTGMLRCWRCGNALRGMPRSRGADLYVCPGPPHGGCSGTAVTADHAEAAVRDLILTRLNSGEVTDDQVVIEAETARDLAAHRRRLDELNYLWASGELDRAEWLSSRRTVERRARAAEAELALLARRRAFRGMAGTAVAVGQRWPEMSIDERRTIVNAALDHVVVLASKPPRQVFQPERLQPRWND